MKLVTEFWNWVDSRAVVRRVMTLGTFGMTIWVIQWSMVFAMTSTRSGADVAMIIAAIVVPLNTLQGFMFSSYSKGRVS